MRAAVFTLVLAAGLVGLVSAQQPAPAQERKLELTFDGNGNVTLIARGVTVREILAEWSRKGGSIVSGADRLSGTPGAFEFSGQSEVAVLSSLLRSAAGVILVPRTSVTPGGSRLDVTLLATSTGVQSTSSMSMPMSSPVTTRTDPNDDIPSAQPQQPPAGAAQPPAQQQQQPQNRPTGSPTIQVPVVPITPVGPGTSTTTTTGGRGGGGR